MAKIHLKLRAREAAGPQVLPFHQEGSVQCLHENGEAVADAVGGAGQYLSEKTEYHWSHAG